MAAYAVAVRDWLAHGELTAIRILGHSLGGKVAMELALTESGRARKLVLADMTPVACAEQHKVILDALQLAANQGCQTRTEAEALLREVIDDSGVIGYLLMRLERSATNEAYQWRFNLADLVSAHGQLREPPTESVPSKGHTLFLKASESAYIQASDEQEIQRRFPCSRVVTVNRAKHWLISISWSSSAALCERFYCQTLAINGAPAGTLERSIRGWRLENGEVASLTD